MASKEERGNFGKSRTGRTIKRKITITKRPVGKRKVTYKFKTRSGKSSSKTFKSKKEAVAALAKANVAEARTPTRRVKPRRVVQNGAIFEVGKTGFRRVGFTREEAARRARIKSGTAVAKDIVPRLRASQTQAERGRQILTRTREAQIGKEKQRRIESQAAIMRRAGQAKPLSAKQVFNVKAELAGLKKQTTPSKLSKLSISQVNKLQKRADAINKRGEKLNEKETATLLFLKANLQKAKAASLKQKPVTPFKNLERVTKNASFYIGDKLADLAVGVTATPARIAQAVDKSLFIGQAGVSSALRKDFKRFLSSTLSESKRTNPYIQGALRSSFKDPTLYVLALVGALSPKSPIKTREAPVKINKPVSGSPTAIALKNRLVVDPKTNKLYYVTKSGNVAKVRVTNNVASLEFPKAREFNFKKLGFETKKQYNEWVKLNELTKTTSGKKLVTIENKILKLEDGIVLARNKKVLKSAKSKLLNLEKARKARSSGTRTQRPISKAAQKRADLAKSKLAKAKKTIESLKKEGFKTVEQKKRLLKQGFKSGKEFKRFQTLFERAQKGNKTAALQLSRFEALLRKRTSVKKLTKAQKKGITKRKETLKLKEKIRKARGLTNKKKSQTRKRKENLKKVVVSLKTVAARAKIRGKKAQQQYQISRSQMSILDDALMKIRQIKEPKLKVKRKLTVRSVSKLKTSVPRYKLFLSKRVLARLSAASRLDFARLQILSKGLTPAVESKILNLQKRIYDDILKDLVKTSSKVAQKQALNQKVAQRAKPKRVARSRVKQRTQPKLKPIKTKKDPILKSVPNPKGYDVYVRVSGKLKRLNKQAYSKVGANKFGKFITNNSIARSFIVVGVGRKSKKLPKFVAKTSGKLFRSPKKKSRLSPKTVIEKRKYAINTGGERKALKASQFLRRVAKRPKKKKTARKATKRPRKAKKK